MRQAKNFIPCPHADAIQHCPLYVAAHDARLAGLSCWAHLAESDYGDHCGVEIGKMDFAGAVSALRIADPMLVAQCEFGKMKADALAQVNRNMRAAGIH